MPDPRITRRQALLAAATGGAGLAAARLGVPAIGTARSATGLEALDRHLRGKVVRPGQSGYAAAAAVWNERIKTSPRAIAFCKNSNDVAQVVRFARENEWSISARSGRHSFEGYCNAKGIVCDVSALNSVSVDRERGTATVGAGADVTDVYLKLDVAQKLCVSHGTCPTVGMGGLTLGGGLSRQTRLYGTLVDDLVSAMVVLPDGRHVRASAKENRDLYWALRGGGGGNFGIATSFTYKTHPTPDLVNFGMAFEWSKGAQVFDAFQRLAPYAPPQLGSCSYRATKTPKPPGPDVLSVTVGGLWWGSKSDLESLIAPLMALGPTRSNVETVPFISAWVPDGCKLQGNNVTCPPPLGPNYQRSSFIDRPMSIKGIQTMLDGITRWPGSPDSHEGGVQIETTGPASAVNKIPSDRMAWVHRNALCHIVYLNFWGPNDPPSVAAANIQWARDIYAEMKPYVSPFSYQNYIDYGLKSWRTAYYGGNYQRLRRIKRKYDPDWLLRFAQGIPPAAGPSPFNGLG